MPVDLTGAPNSSIHYIIPISTGLVCHCVDKLMPKKAFVNRFVCFFWIKSLLFGYGATRLTFVTSSQMNGDVLMTGENTASDEAKTIQTEAGGDARDRSTIGFPYNNLNDAIEVAQAIHDNVGTGDCDASQLSAWMRVSPKSSGFRTQLSAARMFGVIEAGGSNFRLSVLGRMIVDPQRAREARARAFLNVPLYNSVHEKYKGGVLPPAAAFERDIVGLGVAEKQTGRARQVFERSAEQAGFFEHGKNRLVMPGIASRNAETETPEQEREDDGVSKGGGGGNGGGGSGGDLLTGIDPIIGGLLKRLPKSGDKWPKNQREKWLKLLSGAIDLIYEDEESGEAA